MFNRYIKAILVTILITQLQALYSMEKKPTSNPLTSKIDTLLQAYTKIGYFSGTVLVARKGTIVLSKGYGLANHELNVANRPEMKFNIASLTKQFTAFAILQLQEKGLLKVTDSLEKFIPEFPHAKTITLHHLLCHSSGIPNITFFSDFAEKCLQPITLEKEIEYIKQNSGSLDFTPGAHYTYSNSNYLILSYIIQKVSGQSFESYLNEKILHPIGMKNSGLYHQSKILPNRASGYIQANHALANAPFFDFSWAAGSGGMYSTIEDLYRWDRALFGGNQTILPAHIAQEILKPHVAISKEKSGMAYGYGIAVHHDAAGTYWSHEGTIQGFGAYMLHYQNDDISIIILSNFAFAPYKTIAKEIKAILTEKSYELPGKRVICKVKPEILKKYEGTYELQMVEDIYKRPATTITIRADKDHLILTMKNKEEILLPQSTADFFFKESQATIHFTHDVQENVTGLVLHKNEEITPGIKVDHS